MMTKKEIKYIEEKISQFEKWAEEEKKAAMSSDDKEIKADHYLQERLNSCAATTLENLLSELASNRP